jgi:hypothetical protein
VGRFSTGRGLLPGTPGRQGSGAAYWSSLTRKFTRVEGGNGGLLRHELGMQVADQAQDDGRALSIDREDAGGPRWQG